MDAFFDRDFGTINVNVSGLIPGELAEIELKKGTENGHLLHRTLVRADANGKVSTSFRTDGHGSYTVVGWFGEQSLGDDREKRTDKLTVPLVMEVSYAHVVPGVYSEIYVDVSGMDPGIGPSTAEEGHIDLRKGTKNGPTLTTNIVRSDEDGLASTTFQIDELGDYTIIGYFGNVPTPLSQREIKMVTITVR